MELSLFGCFVALLLFNPVVLLSTYEFWACFAIVCLYFAVVSLIYEAVLSLLLWAVPAGVHSLCQTRLDAKLPIRMGLCLVMLFYNVWHVAGLSVPIGHTVQHIQYTTILCTSVQYSTVQCSTVQYITVQYSTVHYSTVHAVHTADTAQKV